MEIYNETFFAEYLKKLFAAMGISAQVEVIDGGKYCDDVLVIYNGIKLILNDYNDIKKVIDIQ